MGMMERREHARRISSYPQTLTGAEVESTDLVGWHRPSRDSDGDGSPQCDRDFGHNGDPGEPNQSDEATGVLPAVATLTLRGCRGLPRRWETAPDRSDADAAPFLPFERSWVGVSYSTMTSRGYLPQSNSLSGRPFRSSSQEKKLEASRIDSRGCTLVTTTQIRATKQLRGTTAWGSATDRIA